MTPPRNPFDEVTQAEAIGSRLRTLREGQRLSYRQLAARSGVALSTLYAVEAARRRRVSVSTLQAIATALGVDVRALLGGDDPLQG